MEVKEWKLGLQVEMDNARPVGYGGKSGLQSGVVGIPLQCGDYKNYRFCPWIGRPPGEEMATLTRYSCRRNYIDRKAMLKRLELDPVEQQRAHRAIPGLCEKLLSYKFSDEKFLHEVFSGFDFRGSAK